METGPRFIVSLKRLEEQRTESVTIEFQGQHANQSAAATPDSPCDEASSMKREMLLAGF